MMKYRYRKITPEDVKEMKKLRTKGLTYKDIAKKFKVNISTATYHLVPKEKERKLKEIKKYNANLTNKQKKERTKKNQPYTTQYINERYNNDKEFRKSFIKMVSKNFKKRQGIWKLKGLCHLCGKERIDKKFVNCEICRKVMRSMYKHRCERIKKSKSS